MSATVLDETAVQRMVKEAVDAALAEKERERAEKPRKMAIIATRGTLDWAYPPLILTTTAAAMGWETAIFFTFYGLNIIHKDKGRHMKVAPLGNPAMPMPVPNLVGAIPGMTQMGTAVMKHMFKSSGVASIDDLLEAAVESGVKLQPCAMTMEVFGYKDTDFIPAAEPSCGAATFIDWAQDADICLFI
jgi:peroxiredoxin family protein